MGSRAGRVLLQAGGVEQAEEQAGGRQGEVEQGGGRRAGRR